MCVASMSYHSPLSLSVKLNWWELMILISALQKQLKNRKKKKSTYNVSMLQNIFLLPVSPKVMNGFRSAECKFIFSWLDCITVHHGNKTLHPYLKLLHQGPARRSKTWPSCSVRRRTLSVVFTFTVLSFKTWWGEKVFCCVSIYSRRMSSCLFFFLHFFKVLIKCGCM